jgi:DNA-directed RNA polymerase I, II, and III subunit RPABC2
MSSPYNSDDEYAESDNESTTSDFDVPKKKGDIKKPDKLKKQNIIEGDIVTVKKEEDEDADEDMDEDVDEDIDEDIADEDEDEEGDDDEEGEDEPLDEAAAATVRNLPTRFENLFEENENDGDETDDEEYLQKFDENTRKDIITEYYPELVQQNYEEIDVLTKVVRDQDGIIIDPLHTTIPFLTKYEKTRIVGERARQINSGAKPLVYIEEDIIDGYLIAQRELDQKKIPFIIKRPLPNGGVEYWKIEDLEIL